MWRLWVIFSVLPTMLLAEIELLTVKWKGFQCLDNCLRTVSLQFNSMNGPAEYIVNQQEAQVQVRWKPYAPFRTEYITAAMSRAGLRSQDVRLRIRGTIERSGRAILLRSLGDNTLFILLGPSQASMTKFVPDNSLDAHALSVELQQQLLDAQRDFVVVVVEGPLFTALRQSGIYLIVERLTLNRLGQN